MKTCTRCFLLQEDHNYYVVNKGNRGSVCKTCISLEGRAKRGTLHKFNAELFKRKIEKDLIKRPGDSEPALEWEKEISEYIWKVRTRGYGVDIVDFYRIIHYHEILWPLWHEPCITASAISLKWMDLEKWYLQNKRRIYEQEGDSNNGYK